MSLPPVRPKQLLGVELRDPGWFRAVKRPTAVGARGGKLLEIPQSDAQILLRSVVRRVADLPPGSSAQVVWTSDNSELLVHTDSITLACTNGLVTIGLKVACDQIAKPTILLVPLAVGTREVPAGLVMHTFTRLAGPPVVTSVWSEAVTAFAWEALVEMCRSLSAQVGKDTTGRPLIPGLIGAAPRTLLVQPVGRQSVRFKAVR